MILNKKGQMQDFYMSLPPIRQYSKHSLNTKNISDDSLNECLTELSIMP